MMMHQQLEGQHVVIAGGSSGMGYGAAEEALRCGAQVTIVGSTKEKTDRAVASLGGTSFGAVADILNEQSLRNLADQLDTIDHLFITASPGGTNRLTDLDFDIKKSYLYGKVWSSLMTVKILLPKISTSGSVTFLTGGFAVKPDGKATLVTGAYAALEGLTEALALELAPIRVNNIRPGMIDSPLWDFMDEKEREDLFAAEKNKNPLHRIGTISDIGRAAVFLMANDYITGDTLDISGGRNIT